MAYVLAMVLQRNGSNWKKKERERNDRFIIGNWFMQLWRLRIPQARNPKIWGESGKPVVQILV